MIILPNGHYYGEFDKGDFLIVKGGSRTPISKCPGYKRSEQEARDALKKVFP